MTRLNFLNDEPWDETDERFQFRARSFGHELGADMLGALLRELAPGVTLDEIQAATEPKLHVPVEPMTMEVQNV